jgi:hypothetical protein
VLVVLVVLAAAVAHPRVKVRFFWDRLGGGGGGAGGAGGGGAAGTPTMAVFRRGSVRLTDELSGAPLAGVRLRFTPTESGAELSGTTNADGHLDLLFSPIAYKSVQWEPHKSPGLDLPEQEFTVPAGGSDGDHLTHRLTLFMDDGKPVRAVMNTTLHASEAQTADQDKANPRH